MLTLFVCDGTSCDATTGGAAAETEFPTESISAILNVDKAFIGAFFMADPEVSPVGASGGSNSIFSSAEDQAIISQFNLDDGSVASFLGAALVKAIAPFLAAYVFLVLHQAWLRQRVAERSLPAAAVIAGEESLEEATGTRDSSSGWMMSAAARKLGLALLAAGAVTALVVSIPIVAFGDGEPEILPEFSEDVTLACPGCINGVTTADYLDAALITSASRVVRALLMTKAVRVREIAAHRRDI